MTAEELQHLKEIVAPIAERYGVERVSLFGSRARGEERPDSDYDFLVYCENIKSLLNLGGLFMDMKDAVGAEIDLVTEDSNDREFIHDIKQDEVVVYEQAR